MDNSVDLPGYKYYRDPGGGRPPLFVTFLNVMPAPGHCVNGVVFDVTADELGRLDDRERNYERVDVTAQVAESPLGTVWTYMGTGDARDRYQRGLSAGLAAVSRAYYDGVSRDFASLGPEALDRYLATTDPPVCPIVELERIDLRAQPTP